MSVCAMTQGREERPNVGARGKRRTFPVLGGSVLRLHRPTVRAAFTVPVIDYEYTPPRGPAVRLTHTYKVSE